MMDDVTAARAPIPQNAARCAEFAPPVALERIVDTLDHGLLVVDSNAWLLFANRSAVRSLCAGQPLALEDRTVMPEARTHRVAWRRALSRVRASDRMLFDLSDGPVPQHVTLNALQTPSRGDADLTLIAIGLAPSPAARGDRIDAYASHYRLTRAEVRVLAQLVDDRGPQEIACRLGIAVSTVRTHLKHILQKTEATGLRQLATMVLRVPVGLWSGP